MAARRLCLLLPAIVLGSLVQLCAAASLGDTSASNTASSTWASGDASPLIANPASVWFAAPGPAPDAWAKPGAAPKQANTPETAAKSQAEASKLGLRRAPSNATAPTGAAVEAAATPGAWQKTAETPQETVAWAQEPSAAAPWASKPSAAAPWSAKTEGLSPTKAAAAAIGLVPGGSQNVASEVAPASPGECQSQFNEKENQRNGEGDRRRPGPNCIACVPSRICLALKFVICCHFQVSILLKKKSPHIITLASPCALKASQETATEKWAVPKNASSWEPAATKWAPGNATEWAPAPSKWAPENATSWAPAASKWAPKAKPPAPARKQPGAYVKAPGGREAQPSDYVPESIRDIKWNNGGSPGNASAKVYPTQADPQRQRPQLSGAEPTSAAYSGTGVVDSRSHSLDPTRVASDGRNNGAALQASNKPAATSGTHTLDATRMASNDFIPFGSQEGYEDVASRVNGQVVIPSDAEVRPEDVLPTVSGDLGGDSSASAAAAPAPAPLANYTLPALLAPDVNASWHLVDSPPGATCEVLMRPYILQQDGHTNPNLWGAIEAERPPTSSPPADFLRGSVDLRIFNNATEDLQVPYTLTVVSAPSVNYESASNMEILSSGPNGIGNLTATSPDLAIPAGSNMKANVTFTVNATNQDFFPRHVLLNGQPCQLRIGLNLNVPIPTVLPNGTLIEDDEQPVSVTLGQFIGAKGEPLAIKGINWFGFETASTMLDGLWQGPSAITQNFDSVAWRIKLMGFNTIRIPFSFQVLFNMVPRSYTAACTPTTADTVKQSVIPPGVTTPAGVNPPELMAPGDALGASGVCNADLPNTSGYARFLFVLRYFAANGFYILIDNHLSFDNTAVSNTAQWLIWWKQLMTDVAALPSTRNRVMVDIMNEPDVLGLRWQGTTPDMSSLYLAAMEAIYPISPTTLFFIEGGGQLPYAMCWGDGFVTDPAIIAANGLSDPNPFFTTLLSKPYLNNVVISPHYYPPSISTAKTKVSGADLWERMQNSFGYLTSGQGYQGHVFPLVIGETGSMYLTQADVLFLSDMAKYMKNDPAAAVYPHATLSHLMWWSWNPNSGDTGGIVQDDWLTVIWNKVDFLINAVGLQPWYAAVLNGGAFDQPAADSLPGPAAPVPTVPPVPTEVPIATAPPAETVPPVQPAASDPPVDAIPPPDATTPPVTQQPEATTPPETQQPEATTPPETQQPDTAAQLPSQRQQPQQQEPAQQEPATETNVPETTSATPPPETSVPPPSQTEPPQTTPSQTEPPQTTTPLTTPPQTEPPQTTTPPQTTSASSSGSGSSCLVRASTGSVWSGGSGVYKASLDLHLQATGGSSVAVPYTLRLSNPAYTALETSWTWEGSFAGGGAASGQVTQGWAELLKNSGNTVDVGGIVVGSSQSLLPTEASINGVTCELRT
ncbi:hypothetical protein COCSUDRAFT_46570 [Coccomyxa subellipsoidea C-169]|uniref:Glycoside hydrolase family 5 domain-containing protein n=1 Tax=Coccomyxa subellipsoidea (strain C-169) TaxID=574566 RepID=I0Z326_COCSC|nr:hypothetical protein COCSUDRAFT_46570 [Coccomyxa subellipsoidea C-169]EIE25045.1 hypothetical protein COCSUDRAFT_46570 [Coccomyxa subellipsoidea C-169]|eukprot:XP_005649589.1 hypothetical protein COCSUDRAFT_46570 [Coccomyxa subellipsoidea C-169]